MQIQTADKDNLQDVLKRLRRDPVRNAWAIQDMLVWFDQSKLHYVSEEERFSYLLISGHPSTAGAYPTLIADGDPQAVTRLMKMANLPEAFVLRETSAHLQNAILDQYPNAKPFLETRMDVTRKSFIPRHRGLARRADINDAEAVAQFFGAPPQAAAKFKGWLAGAKAFYGVFEGDRLASMGSSIVSLPEAWDLVGIRTHTDFQRKGYATEVTSALVARGLEETETVTLTVLKGNTPAIRTYEKLGFVAAEDRVWIDNGTGFTP